MNAFSASEFGDVGTVLQALGLVDTDGTLRSDWIKDPAQYLKDILADKDQRKALLDFLTSVSQNGAETDAEDRRWVEVLSDSIGDGQRIGLFAVFDDSPDQEVHLSLGVRLTTTDPHSQSSLMVPLFRTRKGSSPSPSDPTLLGKPGGRVVLTSAITLSQTPPPVGEGGLRAVGLAVSVPTHSNDGPPDIALRLTGLRLPGEIIGRNLDLSLSNPTQLEAAATELILGLLQAQIDAAGAGQLQALGKVLGLLPDPTIPSFPIEDLLTRGADALADWAAALLSQPAPRVAWLGALATLIDNGASVHPDGLHLPLGGGVLRIT